MRSWRRTHRTHLRNWQPSIRPSFNRTTNWPPSRSSLRPHVGCTVFCMPCGVRTPSIVFRSLRQLPLRHCLRRGLHRHFWSSYPLMRRRSNSHWSGTRIMSFHPRKSVGLRCVRRKWYARFLRIWKRRSRPSIFAHNSCSSRLRPYYNKNSGLTSSGCLYCFLSTPRWSAGCYRTSAHC